MPQTLLLRIRRAVLRHRRILAAALTGIAALAVVRAVAAPPPETAPVLVAAHDLPSGSALTRADVTVARFAPATVPSGAMTDVEAIGRTTAAPLRAGEPVTDVRLVQASLLDGYPGAVAVPVRLGDAAVAGLLRVGDRIDLVAATDAGAEVVASNVPIVAIPRRSDGSGSSESQSGALVVVATAPDIAVQVSRSSVSAFISALIPH